MISRRNDIERTIVFSLSKILTLIVLIQNRANTAVINTALDSAAAIVEELKQLYIADRSERKE